MNANGLANRFLFFPLLFIFYFSMLQSLKMANLEKYNNIVHILFIMQLVTHLSMLSGILDSKLCTPTLHGICDKGAMLIGLVYFILIMMCYTRKTNIYTYIATCGVLYIIISHLVTIHLADGLFEYTHIKLPLFHLNSYILVVSHKFHENKLTDVLHQLLLPGEAIIDAGAYVGDTSIILSKKFPKSFVYSIEPSVYNYNYIQKVKTINNLDNLIPMNILLSDSEKTYNGTGVNNPDATYTQSNNTTTGIKSYTLDSLVSGGQIPQKIGILHYDVEGMELDVLRGSEKTIQLYKPYIVIEMLYKENKDITEFLKNMGYTYRIIDESCCFGDFNDSKNCRNYLFYPINLK